MMFARENSKFTRFLIKNKKAFELYFKQTKCNQEEVDELFTLQDVYNQITLVVNSVSCLNTQYVCSCNLLPHCILRTYI